MFSTPAEQVVLGQGTGTWDLLASSVGEIQMCSDGSVLACLTPSTSMFTETRTEGSIVSMLHPKHLGSRVSSGINEPVAEFMPTQLVVNATTATALCSSGQVYTCTTDPRYPSALGRPYTGTSTFEPVPYLSETRIKKIASGGYMTAAISEDGELFLWGQSNPGTEEELGVLQRLDYVADAALEKETLIRGDAVQDDDVKVLNICIDGRSAIAYDVAIGCGHILVAAEDETGEYVVFAAGCGAEGQLGTGRMVEYEKFFTEVVALRGKCIKQLAAAGWSSFIVIED
jgi:alpha-tubulin suppressor-like RCC1 family protein